MINQSKIISINAKKIFCKPKNKYDHNAFKANWTLKNNNPFFTNSLLVSNWFQTLPAAIPIKMKSSVQTGAKTQFGGLKIGFTIVGYQVFILDCVVMLDK